MRNEQLDAPLLARSKSTQSLVVDRFSLVFWHIYLTIQESVRPQPLGSSGVRHFLGLDRKKGDFLVGLVVVGLLVRSKEKLVFRRLIVGKGIFRSRGTRSVVNSLGVSEFTPIIGDRLVIPMTVMEMEDTGDVIIKVLSNVLNRLIEVNTKVHRILFYVLFDF